MAFGFEALAALTQDWGGGQFAAPVPHFMTSSNFSAGDLKPSSNLHGNVAHIHTCRKHSYT